jgi:hypothetical protein
MVARTEELTGATIFIQQYYETNPRPFPLAAIQKAIYLGPFSLRRGAMGEMCSGDVVGSIGEMFLHREVIGRETYFPRIE